MKEISGNLWTIQPPNGGKFEVRVICTNGFIKADGTNPMGVGTAQQASQHFPRLPRMVGDKLQKYGNHCFLFKKERLSSDYHLVTFPTKDHFGNNSDLDLIIQSTCELVEMTDEHGWVTIALPRPGTGYGSLPWKDVKRCIKGFLDDRFYVVALGEE